MHDSQPRKGQARSTFDPRRFPSSSASAHLLSIELPSRPWGTRRSQKAHARPSPRSELGLEGSDGEIWTDLDGAGLDVQFSVWLRNVELELT